MRSFLMIAEVIISVLLILAVVFQSSKAAGMGGAISGGADTIFGGKSRGADALLAKCTVILAALFGVLSLVLGKMLNSF